MDCPQYLHQITKLEAFPSVKKVTRMTPGTYEAPGKWKRLEGQAPGDRLLQKILQLNRKFIFIQ